MTRHRSKLSERLEQEQSSLNEKLDSLAVLCKTCETCSSTISKFISGEKEGQDKVRQQKMENGEAFDGTSHPLAPSSSQSDASMESKLRELELELAQTKLALVEAECQNQELIHQLTNAQAETQQAKNSWFNKTLSSIREVTKKEFKDKERGKDIGSVSRQGSREFPS